MTLEHELKHTSDGTLVKPIDLLAGNVSIVVPESVTPGTHTITRQSCLRSIFCTCHLSLILIVYGYSGDISPPFQIVAA